MGMTLTASGISKCYGALRVLDSVDFSVGPGEIVAVVGPSGCGKSTLLRILGGLETADSGGALIAGDAPAHSLNPITFVFQDFALLPWRTIAENVSLPLEHRVPDVALRRDRVARALSALGLSEFAKAYPRQLSGGMKQRVGIARALVVQPAILLMDEPLSALDAQTRALLMDDLVALMASAAFAGVYVTHNLDEAALLAKRVLVLSRRPGRVRAVLDIPQPLGRRRLDDPALAAVRRDIWDLLRDDAAAADRELAHG